MTLKQKEDAARTWLRQELLVVTKHLASLLESSNLSENEKRLRALVHHIIIRDSEDLGLYHNIHSRTLSGYLGNNYSLILDWLHQHQCLEVNHTYSSDIDAGFSKSYRIPGLAEDNRESNLTALTFNHPRIQRLNDNSNTADAVPQFVLENLKQLTVRKQLIHIENIERRALGLEYCKWVYHKRFNVRYGEHSKRLFHTVIRMVKEARGNLMLENSLENICYFDITACYPNLLPYWAVDIEEKQVLVEALKDDFYAVLASHSKSNRSRNDLKRIVSRFLCHKEHPSSNVMGQWLEIHCPKLFASICSRSSMALELQNLEADIFVERLGNWALLQQKWFVPMHDGFLCKSIDVSLMKHCAEHIFERVVGHKPPFNQSLLSA